MGRYKDATASRYKADTASRYKAATVSRYKAVRECKVFFSIVSKVLGGNDDGH